MVKPQVYSLRLFYLSIVLKTVRLLRSSCTGKAPKQGKQEIDVNCTGIIQSPQALAQIKVACGKLEPIFVNILKQRNSPSVYVIGRL